MKNKLASFVILSIVIILSACEKKPFDYRNKYIGKWDFVVERREFSMDTNDTHYWDTISYQGKIDYANGENNLLVQYTADDTITIEVDKDGNIVKPCWYCNATFVDNKNLDMYLRWGGHGAGLIHEVKGKKN
jgi:hypothetical protein